MKKLVLVTACAALIAASSYAQTPTQDSTKRSTSQQPTQSDQLRNKSSEDQGLKGWTRIQANEVPESLRQTLSSGTQYNGWQTGTVYRNEAGDMYTVRIGTDKTNQKTYYFDKNGKAAAKPHDN